MVAKRKSSITLPTALCHQAEVLALHLNISRNQLFEMAIEHFVGDSDRQALLAESDVRGQAQPAPDERSGALVQDVKPAAPRGETRLAINQGDVYWVQGAAPGEREPGIRHPHVVIQDNVFNHSRIHTVVVVALTSNLKRANEPGTVMLDAGEANLPKRSVVEVSKVSTVAKTQVGEYIGSLGDLRIKQILAGMRFLQRSYFAR
jgi:mRNA interferase MazF